MDSLFFKFYPKGIIICFSGSYFNHDFFHNYFYPDRLNRNNHPMKISDKFILFCFDLKKMLLLLSKQIKDTTVFYKNKLLK
ncbi:MAG: hypothetical protein A2W90_10125 [Bacteroidetes bacterium GWF2_42_66]|nr:MAG: hypothetical protein A2W92_04875 [Bacteroidetes bacterium GWA2_42_15]OFX97484.1 MAG: hypothetical protein A2W89_01280 [Bacteroidetes bacterium GWE2_42_39]OFY43821.1 MAG: hypothetical protein A2W90_10125 [Bacteroidetes bacterium GWF2_42_66]HBL76193.1 hypothetical protein [Prolixibacteraceae bacterium]HCR91235.1 hypothetical protein [Prolixibacteraceae bacterium]